MNYTKLDSSKITIEHDLCIRDALKMLNIVEYKTLIVTDGRGVLLGTLTDGDIRRALLIGVTLTDPIHRAMNKDCKYIYERSTFADILFDSAYDLLLYLIHLS